MTNQTKTAPVREDVGAVQAGALVNAHPDFTTVYEVPAGVQVVVVHEKHAANRVMWPRYVKVRKTSRLNQFTPSDLLETNRTGFIFRLPPNKHGLALLMVPAEHVIERKDQPQ